MVCSLSKSLDCEKNREKIKALEEGRIPPFEGLFGQETLKSLIRKENRKE